MDECYAEFSSKKTGSSLLETRGLIKTITEKKAFIQQATEVVLSQGTKFQDVLSKSRTSHFLNGRGGGSSIDLTRIGREEGAEREEEEGSVGVRRVQSTEDLLDVIDEPTEVRRSSMTGYGSPPSDSSHLGGSGGISRSVSGLGGVWPVKVTSLDSYNRNSWSAQGSGQGISGQGVSGQTALSSSASSYSKPLRDAGMPKLLVAPKRTRTRAGTGGMSGMKLSTSVPALSTGNQNQLVVQTFMVQMKHRLNQLMLLWEGRMRSLEDAQKAVEFQEAVPVILEWVETVGADFLKKYSTFGRSMEEVSCEAPLGGPWERQRYRWSL